jgi:hypothetical protein
MVWGGAYVPLQVISDCMAVGVITITQRDFVQVENLPIWMMRPPSRIWRPLTEKSDKGTIAGFENC